MKDLKEKTSSNAVRDGRKCCYKEEDISHMCSMSGKMDYSYTDEDRVRQGDRRGTLLTKRISRG